MSWQTGLFKELVFLIVEKVLLLWEKITQKDDNE